MELAGYCLEEKEAGAIKTQLKAAAAKVDVEAIRCIFKESPQALLQFLRERAAELVCLDVTRLEGLDVAPEIRAVCPLAQLLIIAEPRISPTAYLKPSIRPSALLLRPYGQKEALEAAYAMLTYILSEADKAKGNCFTIETKAGQTRIPYSDISYFEAAERKIAVYTRRECMVFYDTLERLSASLPSNFLRCHKGYIVNTSHIRTVLYAENLIKLDAGALIPISRTYKASVKAWGNR